MGSFETILGIVSDFSLGFFLFFVGLPPQSHTAQVRVQSRRGYDILTGLALVFVANLDSLDVIHESWVLFLCFSRDSEGHEATELFTLKLWMLL